MKMKNVLKIKKVLLTLFAAVLVVCCVATAIGMLREDAVFAETAGGVCDEGRRFCSGSVR